MKKLFISIFSIFCIMSITTGCVKKDSMEDIDIITSSYPIEYLINNIYGDNSNIEDIFPDGESIDDYKFNDKMYKTFASKDLFIYNGENTSDIALELSNRNKDLLLIDASRGMKKTYGLEEYWLDPSNMLMMALNIKNGLTEYISNTYLIDEINENYNDLKVELSELDAEYKLTVENTDDKTIVVGNESLQYLEKYGLDVIVLNNDTIKKTYNNVKTLIKKGTIKNIYIFSDDDINDDIQELITDYKLNPVTLYRLDYITDSQRSNKKDYISIMKDNLDLIRNEIYE